MEYSEALEIVHSLASGNQIDANDIAFGDDGLPEQKAWQQEALDTLQDLITNQHEEIDDRFSQGVIVPVPNIDLVDAPRDLDPSRPQACIRISLSMARDNVADEIDNPDAFAQQIEAIQVVEDFIVKHGNMLDASITTIKL